MDERCPAIFSSNSLNIKNHLKAIDNNGLGPADPRKPNNDFWEAKAKKWKISQGDARGRLCMNCEHFLSTTEIKQCIEDGPAKTFKTSMVDPSIVDIESKPVAYCMLLDITCSPLRTCDEQEEGGPIDDNRVKAIALGVKPEDPEEYVNPFEDENGLS